MGVGKTMLGSAISSALGRGFLDSDAVIIASGGEPGAAIAAREGVAALHEVEMAVFMEMVSTPAPAVIAPAASVLDRPEGRALLEAQVTVWLVADEGVLEERRSHGGHRRPVAAAEAAALRERREPWLADVSVLRIDTGTKPIADLVTEILNRLGVERGDQPSM